MRGKVGVFARIGLSMIAIGGVMRWMSRNLRIHIFVRIELKNLERKIDNENK